MIPAMKTAFIMCITFILAGCSDRPENIGSMQATGQAVPAGGADKVSEVVILPAEATSRSIITLRAPGQILNSGEIHWYINSVRDISSKGLRLIPEDLEKGDTVQAVIINGEKEYRSNKIVINNTPPVIQKASLLPSMPKISSMLKVDIRAGDIDNDLVSFSYRWKVNGNFAGENSYLETELKRGDHITVEVTPYDGEAYGRSVTLKSRVYNSLPIVRESSPSFDGKLYTYRIAAADPDGDALTYELRKGPQGMTIDASSGMISWEVSDKDRGAHEAEIMITDNNGGEILVPLKTRIEFGEEPAEQNHS